MDLSPTAGQSPWRSWPVESNRNQQHGANGCEYAMGGIRTMPPPALAEEIPRSRAPAIGLLKKGLQQKPGLPELHREWTRSHPGQADFPQDAGVGIFSTTDGYIGRRCLSEALLRCPTGVEEDKQDKLAVIEAWLCRISWSVCSVTFLLLPYLRIHIPISHCSLYI
jgi:hypothetical protein